MTAQNTSSHVVNSPTTAKTVTWALAGLGIVALMAAVVNKASGGAIFSQRTAPAVVVPAPAPSAGRAFLVIESTVPNSTVTFRGVSQPAPHSEEVTESDVNETIEVAAPGREGRRFWLKLDRPRTMRVELPLGSGMVDATFGETLVALGEQIASDEPSTQTGNDLRPTGAGGPAWGGRRPGGPAHTPPPTAGTAAAATTQTAEPVPAPTPPTPATTASTVKLDRDDPWGAKRGDAGK